MNNSRYTDLEDAFIRQHYAAHTIAVFLRMHAAAGFPQRTWSGIKHRAAVLCLGRFDLAVESVALPPTVRLPMPEHFSQLRARGLRPTRIDSRTVVFAASPLSAESRQRYRHAAQPPLKEAMQSRGRHIRKYVE